MENLWTTGGPNRGCRSHQTALNWHGRKDDFNCIMMKFSNCVRKELELMFVAIDKKDHFPKIPREVRRL
jgi:hypothetical protein